jgi:hypothetical protein
MTDRAAQAPKKRVVGFDCNAVGTTAEFFEDVPRSRQTPRWRAERRRLGHAHVTARLQRINIDLTLAHQGQSACQSGDGAHPVVRGYQLRIRPAEHENVWLGCGRRQALPSERRFLVRSAVVARKPRPRLPRPYN